MKYFLQQINGQVLPLNVAKLNDKESKQLAEINFFDYYRNYIVPNIEHAIIYDSGIGLLALHILPYCKSITCITDDKNIKESEELIKEFKNINREEKCDLTFENIIVFRDIKHINLLVLSSKDIALEILNDESFEFIHRTVDTILIQLQDINSEQYYELINKLKSFNYKVLEREDKFLIFGFKTNNPEEQKRAEMEKFING